jgi:cytochrome P450
VRDGDPPRPAPGINEAAAGVSGAAPGISEAAAGINAAAAGISEAAAGADRGRFPVGASATIAELDGNPHPLLRRLREHEPVSWLPALGGWLVTRHDLASRVMRDSETFTVDDPRFSTARVVGPSMLSLDGAAHRRHRDPFTWAFRGAEASAVLESLAVATAGRLVAGMRADGRAELRRGLAGPLAVAVVAEVLGLTETEPAVILSWYDAIVRAVTTLSADSSRGAAAGAAPVPDVTPAPDVIPDPDITQAPDVITAPDVTQAPDVIPAPDVTYVPGATSADVTPAGSGTPARDSLSAGREAFGALRASIEAAIGRPGASSLLAAAAGTGGLSTDEVVSNAAVLMFGGIETTEGMICTAIQHLLSHPEQLSAVIADRALLPGVVEESLRLEPSAAVVDRYATVGVRLAAARIRRGDLVIVSIAGANRDPAVFTDPDRFDIRRANARQNLGFARGPHFCPGAQLARIETRAAIDAILDSLPGLRLDQARPSAPRGLVFRKPPALHVRWAL